MAVSRDVLAPSDAAPAVIERAGEGDEHAFAELYELHAAQILGYLRGMLGDAAEAEDAAQEVWARVLRALPRFELRDVPFRVWLFRIARNQALDRLAIRARSVPEDPASLAKRQDSERAAEGETHVPDPELLQAMRLLPLAQRQVLVLRFVADLGVGEVAKVLGRSEDAVGHLQRRGLAFLRTRLETLREGPRTRAPQPPRERREPPLAARRLAIAGRVLSARRLALNWTF